jgi:hypothetical protein
MFFATIKCESPPSTISLIPLRRIWNTTSPFLQNELIRAVTVSTNSQLLSEQKTELELIESLRFIEHSSFKPSPMTAETYSTRSRRQNKENKFSKSQEEKVAIRATGELQAHQPPEFQLLNFTVVGNSTVSAGQDLTFAYDYIEGSSAASLQLYVGLGVCEDSSQERCRCSVYSFWLTSILINGSQTAGSVTSCQATAKVEGDWLAGFYHVEYLYVPPHFMSGYNLPFLQGVLFEKQGGVSLETYLPPTLLQVDMVGNYSAVPGDVLKFKLSITQGSFPVTYSSIVFQTDSSLQFSLWNSV